ncbi:DUF1648 domain-containing protein [Corynebacterium sp. H127]|uniref:DUF1648 domain-containing protein n=1 Tax=Corynebacterium sp. H127 TaxID=3133418 RepID=UPI00309B7FD0
MTAFIALLNLLSVASFLIVPYATPKEIAFGVRVPESYLGEPILEKVRREFVASVGVLAVVAGGLSFAIPNEDAAALISLCGLPFGLGLWLRARAQLKAAKQEGEWFAGVDTALAGSVTGVGGSRIPRYPVSWFGFVIETVVILAGIAVISAHWPEIPDSFATHFDGNFQPDAWSEKSLGTVFAMPLLALALEVLFVCIALPMTVFPVYARSGNSERSKHRNGAAIAASVTSMGWFSAVLNIGLVWGGIAMVVPSYSSWIKPSIIVTLLATVFGSIGMLVYIVVAADRAGEKFPNDRRGVPQGTDNDHYFKMGMFYVNKDDPAKLIDKRAGLGVGFNYAHWPGQLNMAILVLILLASVVSMMIAIS